MRNTLRIPSASLAGALVSAAVLLTGWRVDAQRRRRRAAKLHRTIVDLLLNALSAGDAMTERHSRRVADLTDVLGPAFGFRKDHQSTLRLAALLHDMGKIDDRFFDILHSCDPLSVEDRRRIEQHPRQSADILHPLEALHPGISRIVEAHHECWDGHGYPRGLAGNEIPLESRLISVADVFDALIQPRTYRAALSGEAALAELRRGSGSRFDPQVVAHVQRPEIFEQWLRLAERGRERVPEGATDVKDSIRPGAITG